MCAHHGKALFVFIASASSSVWMFAPPPPPSFEAKPWKNLEVGYKQSTAYDVLFWYDWDCRWGGGTFRRV
jgi:hypothetical protein